MTAARRPGRFRVSRALVGAVLAGYAAWVVFPMVWNGLFVLEPDRAIFAEPFALPAAGHLQFDN